MFFEKFHELITLGNRLGLFATKTLGLFNELLHAILVAFHLAQGAFDLSLGRGDNILGGVGFRPGTTKLIFDLMSFFRE